MDLIKCKRCGYEKASIDFYYKSGDEYFFCPKCGHVRNVITLRDRKKQKQDPENNIWLKVRKDGKWIQRVYEKDSKGAYAIFTKGRSGSIGHLSKKPPVEEIKKFKKYLKDKGFYGYMTTWDTKDKTIRFVVGNRKTFKKIFA